MSAHRLTPARFVTFAVAAVMAVTLVLWPVAAPAAAGTMTTTALGARVYIGLLGGALPIDLTLPTPRQSWTTGGSTATLGTAVVDLLPPLIPNLVYVGAITATAAPTAGGGNAEAKVAGLKLLNSAVAVDALTATCQMTSTGITSNVDVANLKIGGQSILNPALNLAVGIPGLLTAAVNKRVATWDPVTGRLDLTVRALDIDLLSGLAVVASGSVVAAEATCSGILKLGAATTTPASVAPGQSGTPVVTVTNTGDIAAPGTTIKIPRPPSAYTLDPAPSVTGGGTCSTTDPVFVICSGVTVPGGGSVQVSLPVKLPATAGATPNWVAAAGEIGVTSTPISGTAASTTISGSGTLVNAQPRTSTGGTITINPTMVYAGKSATTNVTVSNQGPSDASATVTIPLGAKPADLTVEASAGGTPCTVGATDIVCTGVTVPAGGSAPVAVKTTAPITATVGATWDLTGVTANLNGTVVSGSGRLVTIGDPDVYLKTVTLDPATATPGGAPVTPAIRVANTGVTAANPTTITIPAAPAGYTVGAVTTSGGGTCTALLCTGVSVPANGSVTVSVPVTLAAGVTANWTGQATATSGASTGSATGTLVTAAPSYALRLSATGPSAGTVLPGQSTTMAIDVDNLGPSNAVQAKFDVVAPAHSTWGSLTGNPCSTLSATTARCTVDLTAGGPAAPLSFPLLISPLADPAVPLAGGCADLNFDTTCETPLPAIALRTPLGTLLSTVASPATITPGQSGTAKLTLTSLAARSGVQATIPKTALPAGFTVSAASVPGGTCTNTAAAVTCSGFALAAATPKDVSLQIAVASNVTPPRVWTVPDLAVTASGESVAATGTLASAGPVSTGLGATADVPADRTIEPGGVIDLGLDLRNTGPSDAPGATFTVAAPIGTSFGPVAAPCTATAALLTCTTSLAAGASTGRFTVPLQVLANADPDVPIPATCVDLDGTPGCGAGDVVVPAVALKVPVRGPGCHLGHRPRRHAGRHRRRPRTGRRPA
ncbi:choice-of-anchor P family protein [Actinoplanes sp. NPDC026619]|uniref:choice-of-anchor P family protein n=1 Tax=Actinoplanes sp. NPDC026619 TaxID=3155798 RepID=UPI00340D7DC7